MLRVLPNLSYLLLLCSLFLTVLVCAADTDVVINEILYDADPDNEGGEFIELYNKGGSTVDLSKWVLTDAVEYTFPDNTFLSSGEYVVIARNAADAASFYGVSILGEYVGALSNGGDTIVLQNDSLPRQIIDVVAYDDETPWPYATDGGGPSLELIDPDASNALAANWAPGDEYSPGEENQPGVVDVGDVVISEILYQPKREEGRDKWDGVTRGPYVEEGDDELGEFVELTHRGQTPIELEGWHFSNGIEYTFPPDTTLFPGETIVVCADPMAIELRFGITNVVGPFLGTLADGGERVTLRNELGELVDTVGFDDRPPWPIAADEFGASLEVIDIEQDNGSAANWRASRTPIPDVSSFGNATHEWQEVSVSGQATSSTMYFYVNGPGEWLIDDISLSVGVQQLAATTAHYRFEENDGAIVNAVNGAVEGSLQTGVYSSDTPGSIYGQANNRSLDFVGTGAVIGALIDSRPFIFNENGTAGDGTLEFFIKTGDQNHGAVLWTNADTAADNNRFNIWFGSVLPREVGADFDAMGARDHCGATSNIPINQWVHIAMVRVATGGTNEFDWHWYVDGVQVGGPNHTTAPMPPSETWTIAGRQGCCPFTGKVDEVRMTQLALLPDEFLISENAPGGDPVNIMPNPSFESGDSDWEKRGNQASTFWTTADAHSGIACEHLVSSGTGTGSANSLALVNVPGLVSGQTYTVSFWAKYLEGEPTMTFRTSGGGMLRVVEASTTSEAGFDPPIAGAVGAATPGATNSVAGVGVPPLVRDLVHLVEKPTSFQNQTLIVRVTSEASVDEVDLEYVTNLGTTFLAIPMFDDGLHSDGAAGDGIYGAIIPAQSSQTMVHYRVRARDPQGMETLFPYEGEPSPTRAYFHFNNEINTQLTTYHLWMDDAVLAELQANPRADQYFDCSLAIDGIAYPHIGARFRGRRSRTSSNRQWKFRFNRGELFNGDRIIDTMYNIPVLQRTCFAIFDMAGVDNLESEVIRLYHNGPFWREYIAFESPNSSWLRKHDYDKAGEIYKARTGESSNDSDLFYNNIVTDYDYWGTWNKKVRPLELPTHIQELTAQLNDEPDSSLLPWLDQNVDLDQWFTRWALYVLFNIDDWCIHNYYLFLPAETGKWKHLGYDYDSGLTFSRTGPMRALYGGSRPGQPTPGPVAEQWNKFNQRVSENPTLRRIYLLKLDEILSGFYQLASVYAMVEEEYARANATGTQTPRTVIASQYLSMQDFIEDEALPDIELVPTIDVPGGSYNGPVLANLTTQPGWSAVYTRDGSDPRLSTTRIFASTVFVDTSTTLRVTALRGPPDDGDWTRLGEWAFEISDGGVGPFLRGDCNGDGVVRGDIADPLMLIFANFVGNIVPTCKVACDFNADGDIGGTTDAVLMLMYSFGSGAPPAAPFPACVTSPALEDVATGCEFGTATCF